MCRLCDEGKPQDHAGSQLGRRDFLKASTATAAAAAGMSLFAARPARADDGNEAPADSGRRGRRYVIRGGHVMSMDPRVGDFAQADVLVEGKKILDVRPNIRASGAGANILGTNPGNRYPTDAPRIKSQWFSSSDQLVHMIMGGEVYLGDATTDQSWTIGRQLGLQIAAHILSPFGIRPIFDKLAAGTGGNGRIGIGPDNLFIHMTGMADAAWQKVKNAGAQVSLAVPIEMNMRHGTPPVIKMQSLGIEPSLSVDVECTLTADFFTQMRSTMNMQRMVVNEMVLEQGNFYPPTQWPTPAPGM